MTGGGLPAGRGEGAARATLADPLLAGAVGAQAAQSLPRASPSA